MPLAGRGTAEPCSGARESQGSRGRRALRSFRSQKLTDLTGENHCEAIDNREMVDGTALESRSDPKVCSTDFVNVAHPRPGKFAAIKLF